MKTVLLKLDDSTYNETEKIMTHLKMPRNQYTYEAIGFYKSYIFL
jgi:hypothetical protein